MFGLTLYHNVYKSINQCMNMVSTTLSFQVNSEMLSKLSSLKTKMKQDNISLDLFAKQLVNDALDEYKNIGV